MSPQESGVERGFRPQLHYVLMILVWLLVAASILLYFLFVKLGVWRPHVIWWLLSSGLVIAAVLLAALLMFLRIWHGSHRTWSIAIFLLTVTPLIWFASFTWHLINVANQRDDLRLTLPTRAFGIWVGDWFELEARWRYSRITQGQNVTLFVNGETPNVDKLVADMDHHIKSMAAVLDQPPPLTKSVWVRGSLFGQGGRAVGAWAICDTATDTDTLEYLDEHEVAHTVITMMCNTGLDMPMLLAEGWASSQSAKRPKSILSLLGKRRSGQSLSLMQLTSDEYYGRSVGPAYSHGAPLVWYLLERFGGPKFFELYRDVKRPTFEQDVQRILETPWHQIDTDFWQWLEQQEPIALRNVSSEETAAELILERPEDQKLWEQIVSSVRKARQTIQLPETAALELSVDGANRHQIRVIMEPEAAWTTMKFDDDRSGSEFAVLTPERAAFVTQLPDGSFNHEPDQFSNDIPITSHIAGMRDFWFRRQDLSSALSLRELGADAGLDGLTIVIHRIEPGNNPEDPWLIRYETRFQGMPDNDESVELWLEPRHHFSIKRIILAYKDGAVHDVSYQFADLFGTRFTKSWTTVDEDGNTTHTARSTIRALQANEIAETKSQIEAAVLAAGPAESEKIDWDLRLVNPSTLAIAWPILAFVILGIDIVGERVKIRVPRNPPDNQESENDE